MKPTRMALDDSPESEIELLKKIARGDRESFSQLYDRFAPVLYATAFHVTQQREMAEEVVQDIFVQIWKNPSAYDQDRAKPITWAIILTKNRAIDRIRSVQRRARLMEEREAEIPTPAPAEFADAFHFAATNESAAFVRDALKKLPENQRVAIELVFLSGLSTSEAAGKLGEALPTIKARLRRGLIRLRVLLHASV